MAGTQKKLAGPLALTTSIANVFNASSALIQTSVTQIHIVNKNTVAVTFSLYLGLTGGSLAGTEIGGNAKSIAANDTKDIVFGGGLVMQSTDFLTGLASANTSLTITVIGTQSVV